MSENKWVVIGISGTTCSGKSTLAKEIHKNLVGSILIRQDDYFLSPNDPRHTKIVELNHNNWEIITSMDMEKMYSDVRKIIETPVETTDAKPGSGVLILDGFILFAYKPMLPLFDLKYFLILTKEACWERRKNRVYDPPDVPGYFEKVVWPEHENYLSEMKKDKNLMETMKFIDGTRSKEDILQAVLAEITAFLS